MHAAEASGHSITHMMMHLVLQLAAIMMTVITTMLAPPLLVKSFEGGAGLRKELEDGSEDIETIILEFPSRDITEFLLHRFIRALQVEEFFVHHLHTAQPTHSNPPSR